MNLVDFFQTSKKIHTFTSGQTIFQQGEPGEICYVLLEGRVDVQVNQKSVHVAQPGEVLGIMAFIDAKPRSASAVALEECRLAILDRKEFLFLVQETPYFAIDMMKMLSEWLRHMDAKA